MKWIIIMSIIGLLIFNALFSSGSEDDDFKPSSKTFAKVYSNFHVGINSSDQSSAFEIKRAYFGYKHGFNEAFSATVKLDIGSPDDESQYSLLRRYAYFKNAALTYRYEKLTVNFGLIDLFQFKIQEKLWGKRYIFKSFQDEYKFGSSADIGIIAQYKINKNLKVYLGLMNGEGYKKLQLDNSYKSAISLEFLFNNFITKLYYDFTDESFPQTTYSSFIAYKNHLGSIAYEYNYHRNNEFKENNNQHGQSIYVSYTITDNLEIFGRYDILRSNILSEDNRPWNLNNDGSAIISGIQFKPVSNVNLSLNYQDWYPFAKDEANLAYIYFNVEFSF